MLGQPVSNGRALVTGQGVRDQIEVARWVVLIDRLEQAEASRLAVAALPLCSCDMILLLLFSFCSLRRLDFSSLSYEQAGRMLLLSCFLRSGG
jgi:hypothetical protein